MKDVFSSFTAEVTPGISIDIAARRAQRLADDADCEVAFNFNDVRCVALPGGSYAVLIDEQQRIQNHQPEARSL